MFTTYKFQFINLFILIFLICLNNKKRFIFLSIRVKMAQFLSNYKSKLLQKNNMLGPGKKKGCEIQFEKQNYLRHLNRLVKLKQGVSCQQVKRSHQQKKLAQTISRMKKNHQYSRHYKLKQMKSIEQLSKQKDFSKIKSVVKLQIQKPTLQIVPHLKKDCTSIYKQNIKLFERICKTKACVDTVSFQLPHRNKQRSPGQSNDFSILYQTSRLNEKKKNVIKLRMGHSKKYYKKSLALNQQNLRAMIKDTQSLYVLQFCCGKLRARTENLHLDNITPVEIYFKISKSIYDSSSMSVRVIKILESIFDKQMVKATYNISEDEKDNTQNKKGKKLKIQLNNKMPRFQTHYKTEHLQSDNLTFKTSKLNSFLIR